jgi:hypothetical protein
MSLAHLTLGTAANRRAASRLAMRQKLESTDARQPPRHLHGLERLGPRLQLDLNLRQGGLELRCPLGRNLRVLERDDGKGLVLG